MVLLNPDLVPWKNRILYSLMYYSALRSIEALTLKSMNILKKYNDQDKRDEYFIFLKTQKNKEKNELTPIRKENYIELVTYCKTNKIRPKNYVFSSRLKIRNTNQWLNGVLKKDCLKVGITKILSSQCFRKGRVTQLRRDGVPYEEIATITRHQNIRTMMKHYDKQIKSRAYELIEEK